jgi:flagellar basal body-associated protein FliL
MGYLLLLSLLFEMNSDSKEKMMKKGVKSKKICWVWCCLMMIVVVFVVFVVVFVVFLGRKTGSTYSGRGNG